MYGADHNDPDPGPQPGHEYVELVGGPLDGLLLDATGWAAEERATGTMLITEIGACGPGGRAEYEPRPGTPDRWDWQGDVP
ncbi:hypothetical protein [Streptomyces sp. NBC_01363]|uniref:hypothetical protein n=1 Tax=Streptomyces sp. NBC_01363 TaxID=2903840 RepID=UPI002251F039|nr:hypothetical protein [Streptomyces sp. NBC_01363]MCX4734677.1 hypothetical protein [Streptomyces sp. NBC_01363]MCX4736836.1 hypothetical protein [Streptomyces sp. NBC_01363]MCX4737021.1 hypothetical protein [Streptomyces sp. NBC_01363]